MPESGRWKPIRKGRYYCSPACGNRCTWEQYELAKTGAASLCRILGRGWKPRVWENLAWHYRAVREFKLGDVRIEVHPATRGYWAKLRTSTGASFVGTGDAPRPTLYDVVVQASKTARALTAAVRAIAKDAMKRPVRRRRVA